MEFEDIRTILVVGAGQMGQGIAQVAASHGYGVLLSDREPSLAAAGKAKIEQQLQRQVTRGKLAQGDATALLDRIQPAGPIQSTTSVEFAIEAASERLELKLRLFAELGKHLPVSCILASNTSSIPITRLAAATPHPGRVVGMHFMNPVPVMRLVEIIRGLQTEDDSLALTRRLAEHWGKRCVESKDRPGFIVNRILIPLLNEACFALQEGLARAEDIDAAIQLGLNHPMGPLALADLIGLDTVLSIAEVLHRELGDDKYRPASELKSRVDAGWLGKKTGRGFYIYDT